MTSVRVAIIGCGNFMSHHLPRLLALPEDQIVALVDPSSRALAATKQRFPALADVPEFADHRAMLRAMAPDAVEIATPHSFHYPQILDAFAAGCHVLVEKPLVCTAAEGIDVLAKRDASGRILLVSYQNHYLPPFRYVQETIAAGGIGDVQFVTGLQSHGWYDEQRGQWRQDPKLAGGGQLIDWGSHLMDFFMYATGQAIVAVMARELRFDLQVDVDMTIAARFAGGALGSISHIGNAATPSWQDLGFYGSKGTLLLRSSRTHTPVDPELLRFDAGKQLVDPGALPEGSNPDKNFIDAIQGRDTVRSTGEHGLRVLRVNEACWESARTGREVPIA